MFTVEPNLVFILVSVNNKQGGIVVLVVLDSGVRI